ncbi:MAG: ABC transporter substrate-binding protein, partial [Desulfobacterales bacterium]
HVFDFRWEGDSKSWAISYDFDGYRHGLFKKNLWKMKIPYGMNWAIIFNTRIEKLNDIRVREALSIAYNFQWSNRVLWYGYNRRNLSYFMGSELVARGLPSAAELELLEPFRGQIPDRVFTDEIAWPVNTPFGPNRDSLLKAHALLEDAGWTIADFKRVNRSTGEAFTLDFMARSVEEERTLISYVDNLKRLGIESKLRRVESSQAINRLRKYDYEVIINSMWQNSIPLHWLIRSYFLAQNADRPNMYNYAAIRNPAVDILTEKAIAAGTREELAVIGQALDRILLWSYYVIPGGYPKGRRMVYWDRFGYPEPTPEKKSAGFHELWWFDEERSARVDAGIAALEK